MRNASLKLRQRPQSDLERAIEPLASYISATRRPRATLKSALAVLLNEVRETNWAARAHVASLLENCQS